MLVATRTFDTVYGTVQHGRVVNDDDPLVAAAPAPDCWARLTLVEDSPVVEATANPGERRPTRRKN